MPTAWSNPHFIHQFPFHLILTFTCLLFCNFKKPLTSVKQYYQTRLLQLRIPNEVQIISKFPHITTTANSSTTYTTHITRIKVIMAEEELHLNLLSLRKPFYVTSISNHFDALILLTGNPNPKNFPNFTNSASFKLPTHLVAPQTLNLSTTLKSRQRLSTLQSPPLYWNPCQMLQSYSWLHQVTSESVIFLRPRRLAASIFALTGRLLRHPETL